jgi:nucleoside phosphorylase
LTVAYLYALDADVDALMVSGATMLRSETVGDRTVRTYRAGAHTLIAMRMGSGQTESAVSAEMILARRAVDAVVTTGVVGALDEQFTIGRAVLVESVLAWQTGSLRDGSWVETPRSRPKLTQWLPATMDLPRAGVTSGDVFVADDGERERLRSVTGMPLIDMNLQGIQNAANAHSLPVLHLRMVSDRAGSAAPEEFRQFARDYRGELARLLVTWLATLPPDPESPDQYPALQKLDPAKVQP